MRTPLFLVFAWACSPAPTPQPEDALADTHVGPTADTGASTTPSDTGTATPVPPTDLVYAILGGTTDCIVRLSLPAATTTEVACAPAGTDGEGRFAIDDARDTIFDVGGMRYAGMVSTRWVEPEGFQFDAMVVDLQNETGVTLHTGASFTSAHPDGVEVLAVVPTGPDRGFAAFHWPESGRRAIIELHAGSPVIDRTPDATDAAILGGADDCIWARVDGTHGRMCPNGGWEPMPNVLAVGPGSATSVFWEVDEATGEDALTLRDASGVVSRSASLPVPAADPTWIPGGAGVFAHAALHYWSGLDGEVLPFEWPGGAVYGRIIASPTGAHIAYSNGMDTLLAIATQDMAVTYCSGEQHLAWSMAGHYLVAHHGAYNPGGILQFCRPETGDLVSLSLGDHALHPMSVQW